MGELVDSLCSFLFDPRGVDLSVQPLGRLVFAVASAVLGVLILSCDWALTKIRGKPSLLGVSYLYWYVVLALWGFGSGAVGFVAVALGLMQLTIQSCITIAITWTVLFPKILSREIAEAEEREVLEGEESYEESEE